MCQKIKNERFDAKEGKWVMDIQMSNGTVQTIKFVNEQSLAEYRSELLAAIERQKRAR